MSHACVEVVVICWVTGGVKVNVKVVVSSPGCVVNCCCLVVVLIVLIVLVVGVVG